MNVRLIKPVMSSPGEIYEQAPVEVPIIDTIQSWVREFQTARADRIRLDFQRISISSPRDGLKR